MTAITFFSAIKPLLITCKLFGMSPFQLKNNIFKNSRLGMGYNIIFLIFYTGAFVWVTITEITNPYDRELLLHTISTLQNMSGFGVTMVIWISSLVNQKMYITALDKVCEIDKAFRSLGIWMYYETIRKVSIVSLVVLILSSTCSVLTEAKLYFDRNKNEQSRILQVFNHLLYNLPIIIYSILTVKVYVYLKLLKDRYQVLNQHLREIEKYQEPTISIIEKNVKLTNPLGTKLSILRLICPLHHELCKAANMFDSIFGINLLVCFGNSFVAITTYMYYIITRLKNFSDDSGMEILSIMGSFLLNIVLTIWLCWICHVTIEEAQLSGILLHKIDYEDQLVKNQIEMFSLQIAHENLEFSAAGFFPVNFTLLYSIVGGVTTYLVILMQLSGGAPPDKNTASASSTGTEIVTTALSLVTNNPLLTKSTIQ